MKDLFHLKILLNQLNLVGHKIKVKIHASGSHSIVGSDSKENSGEAVSDENGINLADPYYRRLKRLQDVTIAILALVSFPVHLFVIKKPFSFFANCFASIVCPKNMGRICC